MPQRLLSLRNFLVSLSQFTRWLARHSGFLWRGGLAWLIGLLIFFSDDLTTLDTRLKIRGNQEDSKSISLLTVTPQEVFPKLPTFFTAALPDPSDLSDRTYWNEGFWENLLSNLLGQNPDKIIVTFFFSDDIRPENLTTSQKKIFLDPRIYWASSREKTLTSAFRNSKGSNLGSIEILRDQDGIIRRFPESGGGLPLMAEKIAKTNPVETDLLINYRGDHGVYPEYRTPELSSLGKTRKLENQIIFIGPEVTSTSKYLTPLGPNTRHGIHAAMTDHLMNHRTITRISNGWYLTLLSLLTLLTLWVMNRIPPTIALVLLLWFTTLWSALSIYIFDNFYFWLPISSVVSMVLSSYVFLLGYQANQSERKNFQLQQDQKYFEELEQLKNNFVSLISHDLKTPIAKIQAILDRVSLRDLTGDPSLSEDLGALRQSNDELNRYIQSILNVLRVESRQFRLNIDVHDLNEVILEVWNQLGALAKAKDILIEFKLEPIFSIEFDRTLIREVLVNILDNAIKYSPRLSTIRILSMEIEGEVRVQISDNGPGISEEELPLIWSKFMRGKDQELRTKGSGLGLYLVKFFIELHGGHVFAESSKGKGTTLGFSLPVEQSLGTIKEDT